MRIATNVLVTGGAGYLGSVLVQHLLFAGYKVTVLDNFSHGVPSLCGMNYARALTIVNGDVRVYENLQRAGIEEVDAVVALAAVVGAPACDREPTSAITTNERAIETIVERLAPDQRLIYPNTNSGYGIGGEALCTEESPLQPISLYGRSKVMAEAAVMKHPGATVFRFATLFGMSPRMRLDLMVNDFVYRAVRDRCITLFEPHFRRNMIHVRDAVAAIAQAISYSYMAGQIYNAGNDDANITKLQLCEIIKECLPVGSTFTWNISPIGEDPDKRDYLVSNAKLRETGFTCRYSLQDGIRELVQGYQQPFASYRNA